MKSGDIAVEAMRRSGACRFWLLVEENWRHGATDWSLRQSILGKPLAAGWRSTPRLTGQPEVLGLSCVTSAVACVSRLYKWNWVMGEGPCARGTR